MSSDKLALLFKDFLRKNTWLTLILFGIYAILVFSIPGKYISPAIPVTILFFLLLNLSVFYFQLKVSLKKTSKFVNFFMISTFLKLLVFLILVLTYSLINKADAVNFIISFFIIYAAYSIFEVTQLLDLQDKISQKKL